MYGHMMTKFSRMGSLPHFLNHGAPLILNDEKDLIHDTRHPGTRFRIDG